MQNTTYGGRIDWLDLAKGLGIALVYVGHTSLGLGVIGKWIWSFHMPLFFFISGLLFDELKHKHPYAYLKDKITKLLWPYFTFSIVVMILWFLFLPDFSLSKQIHSVLLGNGPAHGIALWFVFSLFLTEIAFWFIANIVNSKTGRVLVFIVFSAIGFGLYKNDVHYIWNLEIIPTSIVFYGIGHLLRDNLTSNKYSFGIAKLLLCLTASLLINFYFAFSNFIQVDLFSNQLGSYYCFYLGALSGIALIFTLSIILNKYKASHKLLHYINISLTFLGYNSLIILATHQTIGLIFIEYRIFAGMRILSKAIQFLFLMMITTLINKKGQFLLRYKQ